MDEDELDGMTEQEEHDLRIERFLKKELPKDSHERLSALLRQKGWPSSSGAAKTDPQKEIP